MSKDRDESERAGGPRRFEEENKGQRTSKLENSQGQRAGVQTGSKGSHDQGGKFSTRPAEDEEPSG